MKQSFVVAALATTLVTMLAAVPAQAQPMAADLLPAYEVSTIVASMGMRPVGRPAWMRGRYVVAAIDRYGREVNVVIDARDGHVLAVRPLARNSFGAPPPRGRMPGPAPFDPMDGPAPPPEAMPGPPPPDEGEFFDDDRQHGAGPPPRPAARTAAKPQPPATTGSLPRATPAGRRDLAREPAPNISAPVPRPRPALAKASDPAPTDTPEAAKPDAQPAASSSTANPATSPTTVKPATAQREIRVIDLSKPAKQAKPEQKPGEAIRF
ncbi:MAG: hypothetical protein AB7V13_24345 [Pseudorhodoplanes sp.]|uniref:hypothetical protein n=1 Tax=Pseudorhodoplanes sp. TaxID=1934341 RepID=UPI003D097FD6